MSIKAAQTDIQYQKLADRIIEEIKQMLKRGELKEGDKLPNQNEFASQLGVSRLSLREALHTLQLMGVVVQKPRVGTVILSGNSDTWVSKMSSPFLSDSEATLELLGARRFVETTIAKLAWKNISQIELEEMEYKIQEMSKAIEENQIDKYVSLDVEFHMMIANYANNRYLINMFLSVYSLMEQFMTEAFQILPGMVNDSFKQHTHICESLKEHDEKKFLHFVKEHIDNIEISLKRYYSNY